MRALEPGGPMVRLRPATPGDLDWIVAAESDPANAPFVTQWPRERHARALDDPGMRHLLVEDAGDGRTVGYVILAGLERPRDSVELLRIVITDKGRGYGGETLRWVKRLALEELRTRRLWLDVRPDNPGARRLYEREGFVTEGAGPGGLIILSIRREDRA